MAAVPPKTPRPKDEGQPPLRGPRRWNLGGLGFPFQTPPNHNSRAHNRASGALSLPPRSLAATSGWPGSRGWMGPVIVDQQVQAHPRGKRMGTQREEKREERGGQAVHANQASGTVV
ncbi:hypothetical protein JMJ77_0002511 [Colletotrichum scovillei]|uniref:Uncharacterized protein n=1 Tax=Colletotrichum scovillei TaxID=1209932 RepID=A0A9P7R841_9PEZI|nr:hypothetical protein JMJ77_0002511 [Colletotrichum scovillei]KAG7070932.1 hypothetical protein JMJ76_0002174 [Colletotrichum scovillei]KAG7079178.1 hypothetical protein JMJ78_0002836 [Colletotrichum scovillei]